MSLEKVALITGASRGIGRAIALELARTHIIVGTFRGRIDAAQSAQERDHAAAPGQAKPAHCPTRDVPELHGAADQFSLQRPPVRPKHGK